MGNMTSDVRSVQISELPAEGVTLLDVREDEEWNAGHAPAAVHIPLGEVPSRYTELDLDSDVYVICAAGGRSLRATAWLVQNGVDAVNVEGGMRAYQAAWREIVSDSGTPNVL